MKENRPAVVRKSTISLDKLIIKNIRSAHLQVLYFSWYTKRNPPPGGKEFSMNEYEVLIETINPCGGEAHANKEFKEIEAASPEAYVAQTARFPIIDSGKNTSGDTVITTGDGKGNLVRYTFTE